MSISQPSPQQGPLEKSVAEAPLNRREFLKSLGGAAICFSSESLGAQDPNQSITEKVAAIDFSFLKKASTDRHIPYDKVTSMPVLMSFDSMEVPSNLRTALLSAIREDPAFRPLVANDPAGLKVLHHPGTKEVRRAVLTAEDRPIVERYQAYLNLVSELIANEPSLQGLPRVEIHFGREPFLNTNPREVKVSAVIAPFYAWHWQVPYTATGAKGETLSGTASMTEPGRLAALYGLSLYFDAERNAPQSAVAYYTFKDIRALFSFEATKQTMLLAPFSEFLPITFTPAAAQYARELFQQNPTGLTTVQLREETNKFLETVTEALSLHFTIKMIGLCIKDKPISPGELEEQLRTMSASIPVYSDAWSAYRLLKHQLAQDADALPKLVKEITQQPSNFLNRVRRFKD